MRWRGERESENVEDRRDEGGGGFGLPFPGGGGMRFPGGGGDAGRGGGIGIFGILIILGLMFFVGIDPRDILQGGGPGGDETGVPDIHLPQSRPDTTNFPVPGQQVRRSSIRRARARTTQTVRGRGSAEYRGRVGQSVQAIRCDLQRSEVGFVLWRRSLCLRHGDVGHGTVLLS